MKREYKTMDGNTAAAHVAYAFTEVAAIYPITPSTPMAECTDQWAHKCRKNIFGKLVQLTQMQSEAGVAGAMHGALQAGALATTFTSSQGLLLMIPDMYKMAGELLPGVIHVAARAVATHALSIFGDHSDVYSCRMTGFAMLSTCSVQEVMDLGALAHLAAISSRIPFLHFFDGFRTSHEIQKIQVWAYEDLREMCDDKALDDFRHRALNPEHPVVRGTAQNPDIYFQVREAANVYYQRIPDILQRYMDRINTKLDTSYRIYEYYGAPDAKKIIVAMGSVCETIVETIDHMAKSGKSVGLIKVRLFRPFSSKHFVKELPDTAEKIYVLDRAKEPGASGEALYLDVVAALKIEGKGDISVIGGRYGLGSKDTTPADIMAVYEGRPLQGFTLGITDDVTHLSLPRHEMVIAEPSSTISCKFWGMGADGTVGANKSSIKIIGDHTDQYVQAYFDYDSKKSGGLTISHLRFGGSPIRSAYLIWRADFVACHVPSYLGRYKVAEDLKEGGAFLLNCPWGEQEMEERLPGEVKRILAKRHIRFYKIDASKIANEIGLGGKINTILQAAFFAITKVIPREDAILHMKESIAATYVAKGDDIIRMNKEAVDAGFRHLEEVRVPQRWSDASDDRETPTSDDTHGARDTIEYVDRIQRPIGRRQGDELPVSAFTKYADGTMPVGTAAYEKRGVAARVPVWNPDGCIQCNMCSYVCPHACIRPVVMHERDVSDAPDGRHTSMIGVEGMRYAISVSPADCTGCSNCAHVCPGNRKNLVLTMVPYSEGVYQQRMFDYGVQITVPDVVFDRYRKDTVKGSQFRKPLLEFSGACAGCGQTPYAKLVTQLFGDRMMIANATGCSSIWGGSSPSSPYTTDNDGRGPAWANSLFEDNAEYGLGMRLGQRVHQDKVLHSVKALLEKEKSVDIRCVLTRYLELYDSSSASKITTEKMMETLIGCDREDEDVQEILKYRDYAAKKSQWIFGGDGWGYDIGSAGLDHVLASGEDVNILIFDTEVYSNTGGQCSKATPRGAVARFASGGKATKKKDLAAIALTYGDVYVAQVAMGADGTQLIKALIEAESYTGPSLILAYAPCISHGAIGGLSDTQGIEKAAVHSGYWQLFRYDPRKVSSGEDPLIFDSGEPVGDIHEYLMSERRYSLLYREDPDRARCLCDRHDKDAKARRELLCRIAHSIEGS